ncbi:hypothetical protein [Marinobacter confluentis]|uniref:Uncharacterized protein n=1 Tax=Marinobacter confluentis TaxID=1697557 RepID=A0A4Z1BQ82_9GAMM|nr:hypothetical protein [Marinobacter confluentis]TGN39211.1 hypothetical protein E5Q11_11200 [Marinobacter confluentis]
MKNGASLIKSAVRALAKHPRMLVPLILCWLAYAPLVVAFRFHIDWGAYEQWMQILIAFSGVLLLSLAFAWSAFVLIELIRQIEMDEEPRLYQALAKAVANTIMALPIVLAWAVIWLLLLILEAIFSKKRSDDSDTAYNPENIAKTVAGYGQFSLSSAFFEALQKGVRMLAFLIFPAIAWERLGTFASIKKGLGIARTHKSEFAAGFVLTELAALIVFIPPAILFYISREFDVSFPDAVWFGTMIYCAFAWSFALFLEQMFVAELYLWHLIWEREVENAASEGRRKPHLVDVKRPSVMDGVADLYLTRLGETPAR